MAKRSNATAPAVEVLEPEHPDVAVIKTDGSALGMFLRGMAAFFGDVRTLEADAKQQLASAKRLSPPTDAATDTAVLDFIKSTKTRIKAAEDRCEITSVMSRVHKKLVAVRSRITDPLTEARDIAQKLHNDWDAAERRRVAEEAERQRLENERLAREERQRELDELERQAVERDAASADLSEREQRFVDAIAVGHLPASAAKFAQYHNPDQQATRLMASPKIVKAIDAKREANAIREQQAAKRETPLDVRPAEPIKAQTGRATSGSYDRVTHSAELLNERLLIEAIIGGQHGIPTDLLRVDTAKLNEYARSLQALINRWPGVRHKETRSTV